MRSEIVGLLALAACTTAARDEASAPKQESNGSVCGGCHEAVIEQWRASMHRASFTDADFQAAYRAEPVAFCASCHAPSGSVAAGVDCQSCHDANEHERSGGRVKVVASAARASCARCHEFSNPVARTLLQSTVTEHRESAARESTCTDCHMRRGDHRFAVSRDPAFLGRAVMLAGLERTSKGIRVSIAKRGVGHRFPTGDVFRNLFVRAWVEDDGGRILGVTEAGFHRDWDAHRQGAPEANDTRLDEAPATLLVEFAESRTPSLVRVQIDYQRGSAGHGGRLALFSSSRIADWTRPLP